MSDMAKTETENISQGLGPDTCRKLTIKQRGKSQIVCTLHLDNYDRHIKVKACMHAWSYLAYCIHVVGSHTS